MSLVLIVAVLALLVTYIIKQIKRPSNFPPGPAWLPFVGNLPELNRLSKELGGRHLAYEELARKYKTNVLGLKMGKTMMITVFSYPVVKAVLTREEFDGRPDDFFIKLRSMGTRKGVTCTDGELWKIQRNFVVTHLKNLGFGKETMENKLKEEIAETLSFIKDNGHTIQIGKILAPAILNIIWALASGTRISRNDPRLIQLLTILDTRSKAFDISGGTLTKLPWLRFVAPERSGYNLLMRVNQAFKNVLLETINEHYKTWTEGRDDDLIYSFITEMKKANGHKTTFTEDQLIMICLDLFMGGSHTTSNTLDFAFLMMILHPDVQRKVQACLDQTFDRSQEISYSDRHRVPYIEAVLLEVERYCHVVPDCGPRRVLRDTYLDGHFIPKDTTVLISLYSVHNDKDYWKDPEVFRPERFLDANGKLVPQERVIPFALGKRRCIGEILARQCIFLFFAEIIRNYEISLLPGTEKPTGKPVPGITLAPETYRAQFTLRS